MAILNETTILSIGAATPGILSLVWNWVNSRRLSFEAERPKLNVSLSNDRKGDRIESHLEIQNVGTHPLNMQSFRMYIYDLGFSENFRVGLANYNDNLFIYKNRILNKIDAIDLEFNYENFVKVIMDMLNYSRDKVAAVITPEIYKALEEYSHGLQDFDDLYDHLTPVIFVRPFFLFQENVEYYVKLKGMPQKEFPQSVDVILFDYQAYKSKVKRDVYGLSEFVYRLNWEKNPAWSISNAPVLAEYEAEHRIHDISIFEKRAKPILSVAPSEIGIPAVLAPAEKRSINFQIQVDGESQENYSVRVHLWLTSNKTKFFVLKEEITTDYHFTSVPRGWSAPIMI